MREALVLVVLLGTTACGSGGTVAGAQSSDASALPPDATVDASSDATVDASSSDASSSDAGDASSLDAATQTDGALSCTSQCACPSGTICTIAGVCQGTACTQPCVDGGGCPCDQACIGGFCGPLVGSLQVCQHDCDCAQNEWCAAGSCVLSCLGNFGCLDMFGNDNGACAACGEKCETFTGGCVATSSCFCDNECEAGACVGSACQMPPGTAYVATVPTPLSLSSQPSISIPVAGAGSVTAMALQIDLTDMNNATNFYLTLTAPDGTATPYFGLDATPGCSSAGNGRVISTDDTLMADLAVFTGHPANGTWTLTVAQANGQSYAITAVTLFIQ